MVSVHFERKVEQAGDEEKEKRECETLDPAVLADVYGDVAYPGCNAKRQQKDELKNAPSGLDEVQDYANA